MTPKRERISDQLRRAILTADITRYRMSKELGIHQATLSRFVHGERGIPLELIDKLGELLGLRLVVDPKPDADTPRAKRSAEPPDCPEEIGVRMGERNVNRRKGR